MLRQNMSAHNNKSAVMADIVEALTRRKLISRWLQELMGETLSFQGMQSNAPKVAVSEYLLQVCTLMIDSLREHILSNRGQSHVGMQLEHLLRRLKNARTIINYRIKDTDFWCARFSAMVIDIAEKYNVLDATESKVKQGHCNVEMWSDMLERIRRVCEANGAPIQTGIVVPALGVRDDMVARIVSRSGPIKSKLCDAVLMTRSAASIAQELVGTVRDDRKSDIASAVASAIETEREELWDKPRPRSIIRGMSVASKPASKILVETESEIITPDDMERIFSGSKTRKGGFGGGGGAGNAAKMILEEDDDDDDDDDLDDDDADDVDDIRKNTVISAAPRSPPPKSRDAESVVTSMRLLRDVESALSKSKTKIRAATTGSGIKAASSLSSSRPPKAPSSIVSYQSKAIF